MSTRVLPNFSLIMPTTIREAIKLAHEYRGKAKIFAGGTDVLVSMKNGLIETETLIKLGKIKELDFIKYNAENGLTLGSLTTIHNIETFAEIKKKYPLMVDAASKFANIQILNMATVGGNVCNASPAGDMLPPLLSMNASIDLVSIKGKRTIKLIDFYTGPGECVMESNEILAGIKAPPLPEGYGSSFIKISRTAEDLSKVSAAVVLMEKEGKFTDVRLSLGAVAPTPIRVADAEEFLEGREIKESVINKAITIACNSIKPISDLRSTAAYRKEVAGIAIKRAIKKALERRTA